VKRGLLGSEEEEPDLNPVKVQIRCLEKDIGVENTDVTILVSPFIGCKVFLNTVAALFNLPPTKN